MKDDYILTKRSQELRNNMTPEEKKLWYQFLKNIPVTVRRQHVIGTYIVDFYCSAAKLVIELDGSQHFTEKGRSHDKVRDTFLARKGILVIRYSNHLINTEFHEVCNDIMRLINERISII